MNNNTAAVKGESFTGKRGKRTFEKDFKVNAVRPIIVAGWHLERY